jgi:sortase A
VAGTLAVLSLGCLGWVGWSIADAALVEARHGAQLEESLHLAERTVSSPHGDWSWPELSEGELVGRIEIESLGIRAMVLWGNSARTLRRAVGHIPGTSLPGQEGNVGMAGHRDSFFRDLAGASEGDMIRVRTPYGTVAYEVNAVFVVRPEEVHVLDPPPTGEILTLVSCYPFYYVGPAPKRFIVQAQRVTDR